MAGSESEEDMRDCANDGIYPNLLIPESHLSIHNQKIEDFVKIFTASNFTARPDYDHIPNENVPDAKCQRLQTLEIYLRNTAYQIGKIEEFLTSGKAVNRPDIASTIKRHTMIEDLQLSLEENHG
ncbi:hypothetical protein AVEN_236419-1 [Araneus ventricosus]|uniref:Uncharacterized protein n=1 Tax=Araneus ventricosus TaxID=182803 RepID=A0A4Y2IWF2_ARAVE|nr:hypothetical protein AVEN_236419-1 [Araneus ventricosus]